MPTKKLIAKKPALNTVIPVQGNWADQALDENGVMHFVIEHKTGAKDYHCDYTYQKMNGNLAPAKRISGDISRAEVPRISISPQRIRIIFESTAVQPPTHYYVDSFDGGLNFTLPQQLMIVNG